ncbi:hypothetical protein [Nocardia miyunensis]|uniref:hypothetical protein n=1 Tax=Nocardia miyunensis TaxID=282684 RepID=UPI00082E009E|nr:hypothetical protein [Nocardia miyunensis]
MIADNPTNAPKTISAIPGDEFGAAVGAALTVEDDRPDPDQRAHAEALMRQRHHDVADRAEGLARQLSTLAEAMRCGHLPDHDPVEFPAREFDEAVGELRGLRLELTEAELIPDDHLTPRPRGSLPTEQHPGLATTAAHAVVASSR